jgi:hypothetical protein
MQRFFRPLLNSHVRLPGTPQSRQCIGYALRLQRSGAVRTYAQELQHLIFCTVALPFDYYH